MTKSYQINLFDGHLIIEADGLKVLVDTGSPVTIGNDTSFIFMGQQHQCTKSILGNGVAELSELMGYNIDILMGLDILQQYYILINYQGKEITFSTEELPLDSEFSTPIIRGGMGEVCINISVKGEIAKVALDTGAKISYIDPSYVRGEQATETRDDFHPSIGAFRTPIYCMDASISGQEFPVQFGTLPKLMAMSLSLIGIYGAIGFDLFNAFTVLLDFKNNKLHCKKVI